MKLIGITGGIGCGKSVLSRILRLRGEHVYDCDLEARRIMDGSEKVRGSLRGRFGEAVCPAGGPIDRKVLAAHVFGSDEHRRWLNALVHRLVRSDLKAWSAALEQAGAEVCFVESAILASSGIADLCDEVWLVTASDEVRVARVASRDGADPAGIAARMRAQTEEERLLNEKGIPLRSISNNPPDSLLRQLDAISNPTPSVAI